MVMSSEDTCSYPDDSELELGLGLSLGGGGGQGTAADGGGSCYQYARILTANDFPSSSSSSSSSPVTKLNNNGRSAISQVAGWPPIQSHRMNSLINHAKSPATDQESTSTVDKCKSTNVAVVDNKANYSRKVYNNVAKERGLVKTSLFVKVNVDGVSIGRKVNLNAHSCYETLAHTLDHMFTLGTGWHARLLDGSSDFVLTYKDKDGDWMLIGDVPWEMFLSSVRRLWIRRRKAANGLAPRSHERSMRQSNTPV